MTAAKLTGWPGFKYKPVPEIQYKLAARQLRVARNNIRRLLETMGTKYIDLAERLRVLRKNPRLNTAQKRNQFQKVLDEYAVRITEGQTPRPAAEAAPVETAGLVAMSHIPVDIDRDAVGTCADDAGSVSGLAVEDGE